MRILAIDTATEGACSVALMNNSTTISIAHFELCPREHGKRNAWRFTTASGALAQ